MTNLLNATATAFALKQMVADGDLLLMPRKKDGGAARINMVAFRARLLAQGLNCRYVAA